MSIRARVVRRSRIIRADPTRKCRSHPDLANRGERRRDVVREVAGEVGHESATNLTGANIARSRRTGFSMGTQIKKPGDQSEERQGFILHVQFVFDPGAGR